MARGINLLSEKFVKKNDLKPGLYSDGGGLALQVSAFDTKAWVFRYMIAGRPRKMGLGKVGYDDRGLVTLKQARELRNDAYKLVKQGIDPIDERAARLSALAAEVAKAETFKECAEGYIEAHRAGWKNAKHASQWTSTLETYAYPIIGKMQVQHIETAHIEKILRQPVEVDGEIKTFWEAKTETASRVRGRIEKVLDRAKVKGLRSGDNPARWTGHMSELFPAKSQVAPVEHHPALPYAELPEFMARLRAKNSVSARALEFTILTACRTGDTIGGTHKELNRRENLWTIPKERLKGKRGARKLDHVIPLSAAALAALHASPEDGQYLFPGGKGAGLSNAAMSELLKGMNEDREREGLPKWIDPKENNREITVHGFRSTFRDWAGDLMNFPKDMVELAISHTIDDKVEAAYRRSNMLEKRRRMMDAWARYCTEKPVVRAGVNVTPIRARA